MIFIITEKSFRSFSHSKGVSTYRVNLTKKVLLEDNRN